MKNVVVKDLMTRQPPFIRAGTALQEVVEALLRHKITGLPVIDDQDQVIGFVSEQDCLRSLLISSYHCEGSERVEDVMHKEPLVVSQDTLVVDLAEQMVKQKPKVYPVVDEGRLVGLVHRGQVLNALRETRSVCDAGLTSAPVSRTSAY